MKTTKAQIPDFNSEIMKRNKNYGGKILSTMGADVTPNVLNIHLLFCLKDVQVGWTMKDRKSYLGELQNLMTKKGETCLPVTFKKSVNQPLHPYQRKIVFPCSILWGRLKVSILPNCQELKALELHGLLTLHFRS